MKIAHRFLESGRSSRGCRMLFIYFVCIFSLSKTQWRESKDVKPFVSKEELSQMILGDGFSML